MKKTKDPQLTRLLLSVAAEDRWKNEPLERREARIAKMHAGRDAFLARLKQFRAEGGLDSPTLAEKRRKTNAAAAGEVAQLRRIARLLTAMRAVNPPPDGVTPASLSELQALYAARDGIAPVCCALREPFRASMWAEDNGPLAASPVPCPVDPALGYAAGNLLPTSYLAFRYLNGKKAKGWHGQLMKAFLLQNPSVQVSEKRILPNLRLLRDADWPADVVEEFEWLKGEIEERARNENAARFAEAEALQESRRFKAPKPEKKSKGLLMVWKPSAMDDAPEA